MYSIARRECSKWWQSDVGAKRVSSYCHVNGVPTRGGLEFPTIFKTICAGFKSGDEADVCVEYSSCTDAKNCVDEAFCADPVYGHDGIEVSTFNILLLLCTPLRTDANDESSNGGFKGFFQSHSLRETFEDDAGDDKDGAPPCGVFGAG